MTERDFVSRAMRTVRFREYGEPADVLRLETAPVPEPGPGRIRVAVHACGVNFPDLLIIQDLYQFKPPRPFAPGAEVAVARKSEHASPRSPGNVVQLIWNHILSVLLLPRSI